MVCTKCDGTGFINAEQIPKDILAAGPELVLDWLSETALQKDRLGSCSCHINPPCSYCMLTHDVQVCDCCGDGDGWYGVPGDHYNSEDPQGPKGPYAGNGGLCKCH